MEVKKDDPKIQSCIHYYRVSDGAYVGAIWEEPARYAPDVKAYVMPEFDPEPLVRTMMFREDAEMILAMYATGELPGESLPELRRC